MVMMVVVMVVVVVVVMVVVGRLFLPYYSLCRRLYPFSVGIREKRSPIDCKYIVPLFLKSLSIIKGFICRDI
jgi:hypothetical protein